MSVKTKIKEWRARYRAWGDVDVTRKRRHIVRNIIGITTVSAISIGAVGWSLWRLAEHQRDIDADIAAERNYRTELDVYDAQVRERDTCIASIEIREIYRQLFAGEADTFDAFIDVMNEATGSDDSRPPIVALRALVEARRAAIDVGLEYNTINECPNEPIRPPLPEGLTAVEALT